MYDTLGLLLVLGFVVPAHNSEQEKHTYLCGKAREREAVYQELAGYMGTKRVFGERSNLSDPY